MKNAFKKILEWLLVIAASIIIFLAVLLVVARSLISHLPNYQARVATWASQVLHQPVQIGDMQAAWWGFEPEFKFRNVEILDSAGTHPLIKLNHLNIGIDLLGSLLKWRIQPGYLVISGTHFNIRQAANGSISINNIGVLPQNFNDSSTPSLKNTVDWLLNQGVVYLDHINVTWYGRNGLVMPIKDIKVKLNNNILSHQLVGGATVLQPEPMPLRFTINIEGDVLAEKNLQAAVYLKVKNLLPKRWLQNRFYAGVQLRDSLVDAEGWGQWSNNQLQDLQTVFTATQIDLVSALTSRHLIIPRFAGNVLWQRQTSGWIIAGDHLQLTMDNDVWPENKFVLRITTAQLPQQLSQQVFQINYLNLNDSKNLLFMTNLLSPQLQKNLSQLNLLGELHTLTLNHTGTLKDFSNFNLTTAFSHLSWQRWHKLPGVENVSGVINLAPTSGQLVLQSKFLQLDFGALFRKILTINNLTGNAVWQKDNEGWHFRATNIIANNNFISINGNMNLLLPADRSSPIINLLAGFNLADPSSAIVYLPVTVIPKEVVQWLDHAIIADKESSGSMVLSGLIKKFPFRHNEGRFIVDSNINDFTLHYRDSWPDVQHLSGNVLFDDSSMVVNATSGKIFNTNINNVKAIIPDFHNATLQITGNTHGEIKDGIQFLQQSPLNDPIGKALTGFVWQGNADLNLQLTIPLKQTKTVIVKGDVAIPRSDLQLPEWWNLHVQQLQGKLQFTEDTLAGNLQGSLFNEPLNVVISTLKPSKQANIINIDLGQAQASLLQLQQRFSLPALKNVAGNLNYHASLQFQGGVKPINRLTVISNLQGITVSLPSPLGKVATEKVPMQLQLDFSDLHPLQLLLNYGERLSAALTYRKTPQGYEIQNGNLHFGTGTASFPKQPGLIITGELSNFSWDKWKSYLSDTLQSSTKTTKPLVREISITIDKLELFSVILNKAYLQILPSSQAWQVQIDSPTLVGQFKIPKNYPKGIVVGNLQRLYIPAGSGQNKVALSPRDVPALNMVCNDFRYADKAFGKITLVTVPQTYGLQIQRLLLQDNNINLSATGEWRGNKTAQQTTIVGKLNSKDIGSVLQKWKITTNLVGGNGAASFRFNWAGTPYQPALKNLNGNLSLKFNEGRIINLSKSAEAELGLGRVLNLFSLQTLPRRLHLDFSDLTDSGFSFDIMKGDFNLKNGNAFTSNAYLDGPVAKVAMQGRIGLAAEDYDMTLLVTAYVTSSLPVVATITGGPIAGAVTWLAGKIINPAVSKFTTYSYKVTGSWDNPNVTKM